MVPSTSKPLPKTPYNNLKVVIVDDEISYRMSLRRLLEKEFGCRVWDMENALQGIEVIQYRKPDLVILDMQMPYMDGKTALQEIRNQDKTKDTSVIVCSALSHDELVMELAKLGLDGYIVKPYSRDAVKMKIEKVLATLV